MLLGKFDLVEALVFDDGGALGTLLSGQVPHVQTVQVLLSDHTRDIVDEPVHNQGFDIAIVALKDDNEASNRYLVQLRDKLLILEVSMDVVVLPHHESFEVSYILSPYAPFIHEGHQ